VDGQEMPRGNARYAGACLEFELGPYQPKAFAVKLVDPYEKKGL
jgi:hypothetical protein